MRYLAAIWALSLLSCAAGTVDVPADAGAAEDGGGGARDSAPEGAGLDAFLGADTAIGDATPWTEASATPVCGDGFIDVAAGEVCDDKNVASGDGCAGDCRSVECTGTGHYEDPATHHCYWRETSVVARASAIAACKAIGDGYLFRWGNAAERDAVFPPTVASNSGRVWIGLQSVANAWTWDDGSPATDLNFKSGEPSGDGPCVEWGPTNGLNDIPCNTKRDYVCEREPAGVRR